MKAWVDEHVPEFFRRKWVLIVSLLIAWFVLGRIFRGVHTLDLPNAQDTPTTAFLGDMAANIRAARAENPIFVYVFNPFRQGIESFIEVIRLTISEPASGQAISKSHCSYWIKWKDDNQRFYCRNFGPAWTNGVGRRLIQY